MILSFKPPFKEMILEGHKVHTIRKDPHNRWHEGRKIHFATGIRTPKYNCFMESVCTGVQDIVINVGGRYVGQISISVDGKSLHFLTAERLWESDGFENRHDLMKFFFGGDPYEYAYLMDANKEFHGKLIHWTDQRY